MGPVTYFVRMRERRAINDYKERLRPLVDGDTVLFGNCRPIKVLGYPSPLPEEA